VRPNIVVLIGVDDLPAESQPFGLWRRPGRHRVARWPVGIWCGRPATQSHPRPC